MTQQPATPPPSELILSLADFAQTLRESVCALLQSEIDLLAGTVIELNALCRDIADPDNAVRIAGISDGLDALRAAKVRTVDSMGCLAAVDA